MTSTVEANPPQAASSTSTSTSTSTPVLSLRRVTKRYRGTDGTITDVLGGVDLDVADGEFVAILGFSGSGKTTLISAIAGLVEPDDGEILVRGEPLDGPGRDRGVVFQSYSLLPWLSVEGNVALAVDATHRAASKSERRRVVDDTIELVGLAHARDRRPSQLSGGMRQRVAVARALAMRPDVLLLDEPLSALDALTRARLQDEIERIREHDGRTIVLVTNDVDEALLLADRIAILGAGPAARIEHVIDVALPRPRVRAELNDDLRYTALRRDVITMLDAIKERRSGPTSTESVVGTAPAATPVRLDEHRDRAVAPELPAAYAEAARSVVDRRYLELFNLTKRFASPGGEITAVEGVNLLMDRGDFVSLIGHSGCGKSTVLSMVAGLADASNGGVVLDGREVRRAGPDKAVVFQAPSLMPWLTARENVSLGVERVYPQVAAGERAEIVDYYLKRVGLGNALDKRASELSNGMRQRVGLARAFALSPKLLLLDEPFGMLDSLTRWDLQDVLMEVWERTHVTAICVTHDVDEAILLADRVVLMTDGPNATIRTVIDIELPRPRDRRSVLDDPRFYDYRQQILTLLAE
jgi:nitrate/nitrite transport system ATP-binding protein